MSIEVEVQYAVEDTELPPAEDFRRWAEAALEGCREEAELAVRVVGADESRMLNRRYRGKDRPTNVLSFPVELPAGVSVPQIGDLVICAPVVAAEAAEQGKPAAAHWAHMTVHGVLHLLGFDHRDEAEAEAMEAVERRILAGLGHPDPYSFD